ncbi:MAG TPA: 30S ribosomal protein S9 [Spirochaetia bacterium]|jgi:small subunit ribosomal protein S9|nr:30S ribosomal protein S9 [Spirochaetia bacterium]
MEQHLARGTGRRKTSVARIYLQQGAGKVTINGRELAEYFPNRVHAYICEQPLDVTDSRGKYDIMINVHGGGLSGQAGAIRHGLARALVRADETNQTALKANGFLTRDPRMVERKKYGQPGARKKFQFSKR